MRLGLLVVFVLAAVGLWAGPIVVSSPDGGIKFVFRINKGGSPEYDVSYHGVQLVAHSPLSLEFMHSGVFGAGLMPTKAVITAGVDDYQLTVGKTSAVHDRYQQADIPLIEPSAHDGRAPGGGKGRRIDFVVRVFNDGLAFRWVIPRQPGWESFQLVDEESSFRLIGDPLLMASYREGFTTSHEGLYSKGRFGEVKADTLMDMPIFLEFGSGGSGNVDGGGRDRETGQGGDREKGQGGDHETGQGRDREKGQGGDHETGQGRPAQAEHIYAAITEARLVDYAGMYLVKHGDLLKSELSPYPGEPGGPVPGTGPVGAGAAVDHEPGTAADLERRRKTAVRVKGDLPHSSPWRVMLISSRAGALVESNIITDLNDPCAIKDVSWIKPGKTDFHWWNGDVVADTGFQPGINFESNQYYIDFCARNRIDYHTVIGWAGIAWYRNDGVSYDAGPHSDVTQPIPGLDMKGICDYAHSKGVGVRVWVHWRALYPKIDSAFAIFERWGLSGMMVDFLNRDDQEMVNIQTEILQKAALHHLHIQFHGAYKPTGLSRTYPNEFTREGTLNYENDKWGVPITPDDDLNVVFTRLLAGPTDYHLGGFRAVTPRGYLAHFVRPFVLGTRCHMLAMYVVLESYLGMVCDFPEAYEGQPGWDFLRAVPTTWDETRVPVAIPGERVTVARRKNDEWWIGTINDSVARVVTLPTDWLPPGTYKATIYRDADDAATNPDHLVEESRGFHAGDGLFMRLAAGGGSAIRLKKD